MSIVLFGLAVKENKVGRPESCNCHCDGGPPPEPPGYTCYSIARTYCNWFYIDNIIVEFEFADGVNPFVLQYTSYDWSSNVPSNYPIYGTDYYYDDCNICFLDSKRATQQVSIPQSPVHGTYYATNVRYFSCGGKHYLVINNYAPYWIYPVSVVSGGTITSVYNRYLSNSCCGWYGFNYIWGWHALFDAECICLEVSTTTGVTFNYRNCDTGVLQAVSLSPTFIGSPPNTINICMKITSWQSLYESFNDIFDCSISCNDTFSIDDLEFSGDLVLTSAPGDTTIRMIGVCEWKDPLLTVLDGCFTTYTVNCD
jgi:hypothetical protein